MVIPFHCTIGETQWTFANFPSVFARSQTATTSLNRYFTMICTIFTSGHYGILDAHFRTSSRVPTRPKWRVNSLRHRTRWHSHNSG
jgi:hypothetical protein